MTLRIVPAASNGLGRQSVLNHDRKVSKLKGFTNEVLDLQPREGGVHNFPAISAGENHLQFRPLTLGAFKDLPAGDTR
jgi:hypothetical protein